jgi:hypothetical protein
VKGRDILGSITPEREDLRGPSNSGGHGMVFFTYAFLGIYLYIAGAAFYLSVLELRRTTEASRTALLAYVVNLFVLWPFLLLVWMGHNGFVSVAQMDRSPPELHLWSFWYDWFPTAMNWTLGCLLAAIACLVGFLASPRRKHDWARCDEPLALVGLTVVHTLLAVYFVSMHRPDC